MLAHGGGAETIRGQVGSDIARATPDWTILGHNVPQAVYNKVMSDADMAASIVLMEGLDAFKGVPQATKLLARLKAGDKTAIAEARRFLQVGEKAEKKFALEEAHTQTANRQFSDADLFGHRVLVDDGAEKVYIGEKINVINPNEIRFSQSSVNGADKITASMRTNGWQGDPIDVVKMPDGKLTSVDNTRVVSARQAGVDVRANIHDFNDLLTPDQSSRFATKRGIPKTWGEAISLRIGKQTSAFRNNSPYGSFDLPRF